MEIRLNALYMLSEFGLVDLQLLLIEGSYALLELVDLDAKDLL